MSGDAHAFNLTHLVRPPEAGAPQGERPPLLLLLHGIGSNERDLLSLAPYFDPRFLVLSLRAPHTLAPGMYAWFEVTFTPLGPSIRPEQAEASRRHLIEFIESAAERFQADPERVYLLGFSQGAIMSLALALTRPDLLAGVVALSGRTLPELFSPDGPLGGHLAPPEALHGFPMLVVHGTLDQVLPIHYGRDTRERFSTLPVDMTYREYEMPHAILEEALHEVVEWLSDQLERGR